MAPKEKAQEIYYQMLNAGKILYWLVESNADLSNTVQNLEQARELIEGDYENEDGAGKLEVQYTITPTYLTDEEYEALPKE